MTVEDEARNLTKNKAIQSNVVKIDMRKPIKVIYLPQNSKSLHENIPVTENKRTFMTGNVQVDDACCMEARK